jgi:hypothetical protein
MKNKVEKSAVGFPFLFLYNHLKVGNKSGFKARMFTGKPDGSEIHCVMPHEMVSHFDWRNNNQIIAWAYRPNVGENFILLTNRSQDSSVIGDGILTRDGHCSYSPDRRWTLTDTYPDKDNMREILLYDCNNLGVIEIGKFFSPPHLSDDFRCDLHPR